MFACHKCDTPACVNPDHLFPGTHMQNVQNAMSKGRNTHRLTRDLVIDIRRKWSSGMTLRQIENETGIGYGHVRLIVCRKLWAHVPDESCGPRIILPKTHCPNGHEFTPENTGTRSDGYRYCRTCFRRRQTRYNHLTRHGRHGRPSVQP